MLKLTNVVKEYKLADTSVRALKGVSIAFRKNEFVSILGPSGCGKTTLLNIIGGLDRYTSGGLTICGKSTTTFTQADWDIYRNHRIGFIFQSYNLIPHQTVLGNVELALTIAGIGKAERTKRAKEALDRVGLCGQYNKHPNQLSGGQCQRVAIARALVNEPEILLADEPTGALDTATSVQIMDLIKEIARERLVIMVTHNPELAEKYSTRIIRLLDGEVEGDTMPYTAEEEGREPRAEESLYDKARELKGLIGYYKKNEPERAAELKKELEAVKKALKGEDERRKAREQKRRAERAKMSPLTAIRLSAQNLLTKKARTTMTSVAGAIGIIGVSLVLAVSYGVRGFISDMQNDMLSGNPITVAQTTFDITGLMSSVEPAEVTKKAIKDGYVNVNEMVENLIKQSEVADSLMINNTITEDYVNYVMALPSEQVAAVSLNYGLDVSNNIYTDFTKAGAEGNVTKKTSLSAIRTLYVDILKNHTDFAQYATYVTSVVENFQQCPIGEAYTLEQYDIKAGRIAAEANEIMIVIDSDSELTDILLAQLGYYSQDEFVNVIYRGSGSDKYDAALNKTEFSYDELLGKSFTYYPNDTVYNVYGTAATYNPEAGEWENGFPLTIVGILSPKEGISYGSLGAGFFYTEKFADKFISDNKSSAIVSSMGDSAMLQSGWVDVVIDEGTGATVPYAMGITYDYEYYFEGTLQPSVKGFVGTPSSISALMGMFTGSSSTSEFYLLTRQQLGGNVLPESISVYPKDFKTKDAVLDYLDDWNGTGDVIVGDKTISASARDKIIYTDQLSLVIGMINSFIEIVTIALVAFTALSLVVSSVMIAIITYVSVVERTKEIGVIRSLGGRKKDVSRLFTAETAIIGFASGVIGVAITYIASAIINAIVGSITMVSSIAALPWTTALIMIGISVVLTLISGVFPARAAAKKDPVVALRTE